MKYLTVILLGTIGLFFGYTSLSNLDPNSKSIYITLPISMFSIILAFLIFIWSNKPLFYKNLQLKGFILEDTLATLVMKIDVGNLLSHRRRNMQKSFTIAFFADGDKLKIAEIYFDTIGEWRPAPKQLFGVIKDKNSNLHRLFMQFFSDAISFEEKLEVASQIVEAVFNKEAVTNE